MPKTTICPLDLTAPQSRHLSRHRRLLFVDYDRNTRILPLNYLQESHKISEPNGRWYSRSALTTTLAVKEQSIMADSQPTAGAEASQVVPVEYRDIPGHPGYRAGSDGSIWSSVPPYRSALAANPWHKLKPFGCGRSQRYLAVTWRCGVPRQ